MPLPAINMAQICPRLATSRARPSLARFRLPAPYNNVRTIGNVVRVGLTRYFAQFPAVIVNSDGGSPDGTRDAVLSASVDVSRVLIVSTPWSGIHHLPFPYHGKPGKKSAFRLVSIWPGLPC